MSDTTDRRCGTCIHYDPSHSVEGMQMGECQCPIPDSIMDDFMVDMCSAAGRDCPCWRAKEADNAHQKD